MLNEEVQYAQSGAPYDEYGGYHSRQEQPGGELWGSLVPGTLGYDANSYYYYDSQESPPTTEQNEDGYQHEQQSYVYDTSASSAAPADTYAYVEASDAVDSSTHADYSQEIEYDHPGAGPTGYAGGHGYYASLDTQDSQLPASDTCNVVEAHAVAVDEATAYEDILAPLPPEWHCNQCTFLNPIAQSFCEMCQGHISASPDMAGYPFARVGSVVADSAANEVASASSAAVYHPRSIPTATLYTPSAPSFEAMEDDDANASMAVVVTPTVAERDAAGSSEAHYVIHPTPVLHRQQQSKALSPPAPENYLALAFKPTATIPTTATRIDDNAATRTDHGRRCEHNISPEYSF